MLSPTPLSCYHPRYHPAKPMFTGLRKTLTRARLLTLLNLLTRTGTPARKKLRISATERGATPSGFPPPSAAPPSPKKPSRHLRRLEPLGGMPRPQGHEPQRGKAASVPYAPSAPAACRGQRGGAIAPFVRTLPGARRFLNPSTREGGVRREDGRQIGRQAAIARRRSIGGISGRG